MARPSSGLFETHGLPPELTVEELRAHGMDVRDWHDGFDRARREHQDRSRAGSRRKFAGGLADSGAERVVRMHTAAASGSSASSRPGVRRIRAAGDVNHLDFFRSAGKRSPRTWIGDPARAP